MVSAGGSAATDTGEDAAAPGDGRAPGRDFIREIIDADVRAGKNGGRVVTRFPPEPNGYLHIGHATAINLNFGIAREYPGARCHLRFDDTNPETEDIKYVEAAIEDIRWLGFDWGEHLYFASDYFEEMYRFAEELILKGLAYVDSSTEEEIREARGTVTEPGRPTPYRDRSVEENLDLFRRMRAGEFPDGAHVLRARIDLASPNMLMRDPILYRIRHAPHYRQGDKWCIYPLYDYAHPIEDALECVTHSICTLEFENNRELYDWVVENTSVPCRPRQYEFARRNLDYTVMSKRKLLQLVEGGHVRGWDDPRMPTIAGLRRRGVTPEAIRAFCDLVGIAKAGTRVDIGKLEFAIRDDLNQRAPRVLCVLRPLKVVITNYPEGQVETLDSPYWPHDVPKEGSRPVPFAREIFIERDDFAEEPPPGFHRLAPGREVRLRYAYVIRCDEVVKDASGDVVELRCTYDPRTRGGATPDGRKVRGTIHWVSAAHALPCEVRLYDRLFTVPDPDAVEDVDFRTLLNPESLVVVPDARIEPSVADDPPGSRYQFERLGYFFADPVDSAPGRLVYNRTVTLRDSWAKEQAAGTPAKGAGAARRAAGPSPAEPEARAPGPAARVPDPRTTRAGDEGAEIVADEIATEVMADVATEAARARGTAAAPPLAPEIAARIDRYVHELGLPAGDAELLARDEALAALFEDAVARGAPARSAANWIIHELAPAIRATPADAPAVTGAALAALVRLVDGDIVSSSAAREVLAEMVRTGEDPGAIVERRGLRQVSDPAQLEPHVQAVLAANPQKVEEYRRGRTGLMGFFVGQVMGRTGGRANPEVLRRILEERLS